MDASCDFHGTDTCNKFVETIDLGGALAVSASFSSMPTEETTWMKWELRFRALQ